MNTMKLDRNAILNASVGEIVTVTVPEWGGDVCLRPLSGAEFSAAIKEGDSGESITHKATVLSICDETGARLFTVEDVPVILSKSYSSIKTLIKKVLEINRLTEESADAAKKA
jgi:hypothetical protein